MSSKMITLRKVGGFYQTFDNDALIISYLFNYKIVNSRCGFPVSVINKVTNVLEEKSISYILKQDEEQIKDFKRKNNYDKYLEKSKVKDNLNNRIQNILKKIETLNKEKLEKILTLIEDNIYE